MPQKLQVHFRATLAGHLRGKAAGIGGVLLGDGEEWTVNHPGKLHGFWGYPWVGRLLRACELENYPWNFMGHFP